MTRTGQAAIDYARSRVGPNAMPASGYCLQFVRQCFDVGSYYASAIDAWNGAQRRHPGDRNPPAAVPLYFLTPSVYDHVVFGGDPGEIITTFNRDVRRYTGANVIAQIERDFTGTYLGWAEDINRVTVWTPGEDDDMPSADEVAQAVWNYTIHGTDPSTGAPWADGAAAWLRDARIDSQPAYAATFAAQAVWASIINGNNPTTGEPWSDVASAWLRDARTDSQPAHVAGGVWDYRLDRPGTPTADAGSYITETALASGAVDTDLETRNHHQRDREDMRVHLHDSDVQRIAVAVAAIIGATHEDDE